MNRTLCIALAGWLCLATTVQVQGAFESGPLWLLWLGLALGVWRDGNGNVYFMYDGGVFGDAAFVLRNGEARLTRATGQRSIARRLYGDWWQHRAD